MGDHQRHAELSERVRSFLLDSEWIAEPVSVKFLAAGEYNENYLVETSDSTLVFRINHGSQLGLTYQIRYEYEVLKAVEASQRTPVPIAVTAGQTEFGDGALLMSFIPGRSFAYEIDDTGAAETFAAIHSLPISPDLITQRDPVRSIVDESTALIERFPDHPLGRQRETLLRYRQRIEDQIGADDDLFGDEHLCVVNTEVNSGNFIVSPEAVCLVDWEKAVISHRYQDLGHFLVPTTTRWKTDYTYNEQRRERFLRHYAQHVQIDVPFDLLSDRTALMERVILLRALSWCFMAYYEYTHHDRPLTNEQTFRRIREYMDNLEWYLA